MYGSVYRCVLCGDLRIPLTRLGTGSICAQCEHDLVNSNPTQPGYLEQAKAIGRCLALRTQRLLKEGV